MPPKPAPPPSHIGRYRIVRRLGVGGMAEVFLARSTGAEGVDKQLVLKRILPNYSASQRFVNMFVDEAKVAMRLNHPNIVQVYAFEQVQSEFLLAMEFVDGVDLGRLLSALRKADKRVSYGLAAFIAMEVAKGLDYAHSRKDENGGPLEIVHRDVSPQNVLVSYDGAVKVADFGIARAKLVSEDTGVIKGKFAYMSPEQAKGQRVDKRSDVYSLGVVLAEMLMNQPMYPGSQGMDVLELVRTGQITLPSEVVMDIPPQLDAIVRQALAPLPADRYQSARAFAYALSRWLHEQQEVVDGSVLENLLDEVLPSGEASGDSLFVPARDGTQATLAGALPSARDLREQLHVITLVVRVSKRDHNAADHNAADHNAADPSEASQNALTNVLANLAFKYDAVFERTHTSVDAARSDMLSQCRFLVGLGRPTLDDPLRAVRLATDVQEAVEALEQSARALSDSPPLACAVGISRGVVSPKRTASGAIRYEGVDRVARLAEDMLSKTEPSEIWVSGDMFRLTRRVYRYAEHSLSLQRSEERPLGVDGSMRAYRLSGMRTKDDVRAESAQLAVQYGLLGRSEELAALSDHYQEAVNNSRLGTVAIFGEMGIGKTALVQAALSRFSPKPRVLHVEAAFGNSDTPYAACAELIREAAELRSDADLLEVRTALRALVARYVSAPQDGDLGFLQNEVFDTLELVFVPQEREREDLGDLRTKLFHVLRVLLEGMARVEPVVVWVDSAQFMDAGSLSLMKSLVSGSGSAPILVLIASRPDDEIENIVRGTPLARLNELSEADTNALVAARLHAEVPRDVLLAIYERSAGNPFFVIELVDALIERKALSFSVDASGRTIVRSTGVAFTLPTTLEGALASRIAATSDGARHALRWLAVAGPGLSERELFDIAAENLSAAFDELVRASLATRSPQGVVQCSNAVVRHVAYSTLEADSRTRMHKRVATYFSSRTRPVEPSRIARHHEIGGDAEAAYEAWMRAARDALAVFATIEAAQFSSRAIALSPSYSQERFRAHELREHCVRLLGNRVEQRNDLEAMRTIAERRGEHELLGAAYNRLARMELEANSIAGVDALLTAALESNLASKDRAAEAETLRLFGFLRRIEGDGVASRDFLERALARVGTDKFDSALRGSIYVQKSLLLWQIGDLEGAMESASFAFSIFRRIGHKRFEALALFGLGLSLFALARFEDAALCLRASIDLDRETGDRIRLGRKLTVLGYIYCEMCDLERATSHLQRALDVFATFSDPPGEAEAWSVLAFVAVDLQGDAAAARAKLVQLRLVAQNLGTREQAYEKVVVGFVSLHEENYREAETAAAEAVSIVQRRQIFPLESLAQAIRAYALAKLGQVDDAREIAEVVATMVREHPTLERGHRILALLTQTYETLGMRDEAEQTGARLRSSEQEILRRLSAESAHRFAQKFRIKRTDDAEAVP